MKIGVWKCSLAVLICSKTTVVINLRHRINTLSFNNFNFLVRIGCPPPMYLTNCENISEQSALGKRGHWPLLAMLSSNHLISLSFLTNVTSSPYEPRTRVMLLLIWILSSWIYTLSIFIDFMAWKGTSLFTSKKSSFSFIFVIKYLHNHLIMRA